MIKRIIHPFKKCPRVLLLFFIGILICCQSEEGKILEEARLCFDSYRACYDTKTYTCLREQLDSASIVYYSTILDTVRMMEEEDLKPFILSMPFKRLTAVYTHFFYHAYKNKKLKAADLDEAFGLLDSYALLGHDFSEANFQRVDQFKGNRVWGFATFDYTLDGKIKKRLEFVRENGELKFSHIYRNSLANYRLYEGEYDRTSIGHIIGDKFNFDDKPARVQFSRLVDVLGL